MKKIYREILKEAMRDALRENKEAYHRTQAEMAERLSISVRFYAYLMSGKTMCSALTLVLFLLDCCPDHDAFLEQLRTALEHARDEQ